VKKHIPALDGLRGIACLMIFLGHFIHQRDHVSHTVTPFWIRVVSQYWSGVDLFFVLSGFVIFLSLSGLTERMSTPRVFRSFFTSRAFRILPVYLLLILSYFYIPFRNNLMNSDLFISSVPAHVYLFFGQSWWMVLHHRAGAPFVQPTWSLCAEVFLYVLLLLFVCFIPRRHVLKAMAGAAVTSLVLRAYIAVSGGDLFAAYMLPVCRMDAFMLGGIIAYLHENGHLVRINTLVLDGLIALFAVTFIVMTYNDLNLFGRPAVEVGYAFYAVFFGAIVARVAQGGSFGFLEKGPLAYLGTVSYFVYLAHLPIVYAMSFVPMGALLNLFVTSAVVLGAAGVSWRWLERPLIERGKVFNARIPAS
jgi:peptidoglycan/LPS O-acetylase OafA/YrhL